MDSHGDWRDYSKGCRCDLCRSAWRVYISDLRAKRGMSPPPEHGVGGYTNYGCRCDVCIEGRREYMRGYNYGLKPEEYAVIIEKQKGLCAICLEVMGSPRVDHNHINGLVRGLLCSRCNSGLGKLGDSLEVLRNAILYLRGASP